MNGNQATIPSKDIPRPSGLDLGCDEFFRELLASHLLGLSLMSREDWVE